MIQRLKKYLTNETLWKLIFSWVFVCAAAIYLTEGEVSLPTRSVLNLVWMALAWTVFSARSRDRRIRIISAVCGCLFSLALVAGQSVYLSGSLDFLTADSDKIFKAIVKLVGFSCFFSALLSILLDKVQNYEGLPLLQKPAGKGKTFLRYIGLWLTTLALWLPCYLAYYPGIMQYDSLEQIEMAFYGFRAYTTHHPPLHTMILQFCVWIGDVTGMEIIMVYSVIQMILMSAVMAGFMMYIVKRLSNTKVVLITLAVYYVLNPIIAIFSFEMTKDSYFLMAFLLFTMALDHYIRHPEDYRAHPVKCVLFALTILLSMLFRNNAYYVILVLFPLLLIFWGKRRGRLVLAIIFVAAIGACQVITGPVYDSLGIWGNGIHEMTAVPMQQIALTYVEEKDHLDEETVEEIGRFLDVEQIEGAYNPRFYDPIRDIVDQEVLDENRGDFFALWWKIARQYPGTYTRAFAMLNLPYWYPDAKTPDEYSKAAYIEDGITYNEFYLFERESKIPWLLEFYQNIANYSLLGGIPVINVITSVSLPIWFLLAMLAILLSRRMYRDMLTVLPSVLLWGTYILGPVSNFRYILPIFALYPFYLLLALRKKDGAEPEP